jgi:hypothetical protein
MFGNPKDMAKEIIDTKYAATTLAEGGEVGDDKLHGLHSAAQDLMKALKSDDAEDVAIAFHALSSLCDEMPKESEEE